MRVSHQLHLLEKLPESTAQTLKTISGISVNSGPLTCREDTRSTHSHSVMDINDMC